MITNKEKTRAIYQHSIYFAYWFNLKLDNFEIKRMRDLISDLQGESQNKKEQ